MKEQFETWFENDIVGAEVTFPAFTDGEYVEGDLYDDRFYFMLQAMWMSWKAATSALQAKCEALAAENAGLKRAHRDAVKALDDTCFEMGMMKGEMAANYAEPPTPATDAFIAEQRAIGAELCVRALATSDDDDFIDAPNVCSNVAAQLRQGGAA